MDCNFKWESLVNQILTNLNYLKKLEMLILGISLIELKAKIKRLN